MEVLSNPKNKRYFIFRAAYVEEVSEEEFKKYKLKEKIKKSKEELKAIKELTKFEIDDVLTL